MIKFEQVFGRHKVGRQYNGLRFRRQGKEAMLLEVH